MAEDRVWMSPVHAYVVISVGLGLLMVGHTSNRMWSNVDFWVWLGPVREFAERPFDPSHPLIAVDAPDSYMGPYSFILGGITRLTGADPVDVMAIAGIFNLAILVTGLWQLTRCVSKAAWAPPLALVFTLIAWGWQPWRWSGYPNLNSLGTVLPLGSTFAYGTGLFFLAALWGWLDSGNRTQLAVAVVAFPLTLLSHQATGLWVALVAIGFTAGRITQLTRRQLVELSAATALSVVIVLAWPFYSVAELSASIGAFNNVNTVTYRRVALRFVLALPGLVILGWRLRRSRTDPLALAGLIVGAAFVFGWMTDRGSLGRMLPGLALMAHLAMADWFAVSLSARVPTRYMRRVSQGALVAIVLLGLLGTAPGWLRSVPRNFVPEEIAERLRLTSYVEPNLRFVDYLDGDDVVAAVTGASIPIGGVAAKVLSVRVPEPFIDDERQRSTDIRVMLDPLVDPDVRDTLIARYGPDWLVVELVDAEPLVQQLPGAVIVGEVNGFALIRLESAADSSG
jgi:hypothetical protein